MLAPFRYIARIIQNLFLRLRFRYRFPILALFVTWVVVVALGFTVAQNREYLTTFGIPFSEQLGLPPISEEFYVSFLASWFEDVLFFTILGIPALFLFSRDPINHALNARIAWLFAGRHRTNAVVDFLKERIQKISAFVPDATIRINVDSYNKKLNAYRLTISFQSQIYNLLRNETQYDNLEVIVYVDDVEPEDGILGAITELTISHPGYRGKHQVTSIIDHSPVVIEQGNTYKKISREIEIEADSYVDYRYAFWQWSKIGVVCDIGVLRFTQKLTMIVSSSCGNDDERVAIPFEVGFSEKVGTWREPIKGCQVTKGQRFELPALENVKPGQKVDLVFSPPETM